MADGGKLISALIIRRAFASIGIQLSAVDDVSRQVRSRKYTPEKLLKIGSKLLVIPEQNMLFPGCISRVIPEINS
jgi:hypothetical protein